MKNINWLAILSLLFTLTALFLSITVYLFVFAVISSLLALLAAYYAQKSTFVKILQYINGFILFFWSVIVLIAFLG